MGIIDEPFESDSEDATRRWGFDLGKQLASGTVLGLVGELGAGKTLLTGAIMRGAGLAEDIRVTSPTFTLMNRYPGKRPYVHIDMYRLDSASDAHEAGIAEVLLDPGEGIVVVEWFERFPELWPDEYLRLDIARTGPTSRRITSTGSR